MAKHGGDEQKSDIRLWRLGNVAIDTITCDRTKARHSRSGMAM